MSPETARALARIHADVDRIGDLLGKHTARRLPWGKRLHDDAMAQILEIMQDRGTGEGREMVWHLILQGYDRRILSTASRAGRRKYRDLTQWYADEVERPEDAGYYRFKMRYRARPEVAAVKQRDPFRACLQRAYHHLGHREVLGDDKRPTQVGGQDELLVTEHVGFAMAMDGWIWRVGWEDGSAEPLAKPPRMPAGAALHDDRIFFCSTRWSRRVPPTSALGGIYSLDSTSESVSPVVTRVPWRERERRRGTERSDPAAVRVYTNKEIDDHALPVEKMELGNSRPICYCNDLAISGDGRFLYFTEPSPYTSMGLESKVEVVKLTRNGFLWRVDLNQGTISLVARDLAFADGVLALADGRALVTELSRFRMLALDFDAGTAKEICRDLPGMPDGVARYDGKIWQALLHERTWKITLVHNHRYLKRLAYPLVSRIKPPKGCGLLVLDEASLEPIYWGMHDGSRLHHLATIAPSSRGIFLPSFDEGTRGLHWIADPTQ